MKTLRTVLGAGFALTALITMLIAIGAGGNLGFFIIGVLSLVAALVIVVAEEYLG